jgi:hypothetical protein
MANCTYTVPDLNTSGDTLYGPRICNQPFIDWVWSTHGFNGTYWQGGWGFDDACNNTKPLCRALVAFWLLNFSAQDFDNEDWNGDILHWGCRYVREQLNALNNLRAQCGDGSAIATTFNGGCAHYRDTSHNACENWDKDCCDWWPCSWVCRFFTWVCDAWVWVTSGFCDLFVPGRLELYLGFFYNEDVVTRAGTLVHESRHVGGKPHDANFPPRLRLRRRQVRCRLQLGLPGSMDVRRPLPLVVPRSRNPNHPRPPGFRETARQRHHR